MYILVWLMVLHFIADFILQSREMGKKKSSELKWLSKHLWIQFGVFFVGITPMMLFRYIDAAANDTLVVQYPLSIFVIAAALKALSFSSINTLIHGLIDWNIWKGYKLSVMKRLYHKGIGSNHALVDRDKVRDVGLANSWMYWEDHWFYTTIGFDQLLHSATIVILAWWLL